MNDRSSSKSYLPLRLLQNSNLAINVATKNTKTQKTVNIIIQKLLLTNPFRKVGHTRVFEVIKMRSLKNYEKIVTVIFIIIFFCFGSLLLKIIEMSKLIRFKVDFFQEIPHLCQSIWDTYVRKFEDYRRMMGVGIVQLPNWDRNI